MNGLLGLAPGRGGFFIVGICFLAENGGWQISDEFPFSADEF
ncbi:MAG: hypothetical protein ACQEV7_13345 [Bacillota bacterium]